jgi:hypothetical protein
MNIEPDPGLSLRHVGTPMIAVRAQATPEPSTRAPHARVPTLTPRPDRPAAQEDEPYGLARQFTRKPRTADHAPGLPAESNARARQKRSAFGSDVVENCEAVKAVWFTTVVENVFDVLT